MEVKHKLHITFYELEGDTSELDVRSSRASNVLSAILSKETQKNPGLPGSSSAQLGS